MSDGAAGPARPRIEFPCDYPIKVFGRSGLEFEVTVCEIIERHAPAFARDKITRRSSREGKFIALTFYIVATGEPQLKAMHAELMASEWVQMVL